MQTRTILNPVIGFGTGRCGTKSLARILDSCVGCYFTHEKYLIKWGEINQGVINDTVKDFKDHLSSEIIRGIVSLTYINLIPELMKIFPGVKLIHIYRNKTDVVRSFTTQHGNISRITPETREKAIENALIHVNANNIHPLAGSPYIFPTLNASSTEESYEKYYDYYMGLVDNLRTYYNIYDLNVKDLSSDKKLAKLYTFIEIPKNNRRFPERRVYNRG